MTRRLQYEIPGPDWRVDAEALEGDGLSRIFAPLPARPLVVDVGFGRGEFLMQLAEKERGAAFLGVEVSFKRVLKMARRLARTDLTNVRLVQGGAEGVLAQLPAGCVDCFWINFPDPWPKKRHHRRRLIQPASVDLLVRGLVPGGLLNVATDHAGYAEHVDEVLRAEPRLENVYAPEAFRRAVDDRPPTAYELEWRAQGRSFHFFRYRKPHPRPSKEADESRPTRSGLATAFSEPGSRPLQPTSLPNAVPKASEVPQPERERSSDSVQQTWKSAPADFPRLRFESEREGRPS